MGCKIFDYEKNDYCGEPELIKNCCYDHAVICTTCGIEPSHPYSKICDSCRFKSYMEVENMENAIWSDISDYGDLMTLDDFQEMVDCGGFIDYDGYGNYVLNGKESNFITWPSKFKINRDNRFTHIIWFNR